VGEQNLAIIMGTFRAMFNQPLRAAGSLPPAVCPVPGCRVRLVYLRALHTHLEKYHEGEDVHLDEATLAKVTAARVEAAATEDARALRQRHLQEYVAVSVDRQKEDNRTLSGATRAKRKQEQAERGGLASWEVSQRAGKKLKAKQPWAIDR
jgi:hypothetical protein